jgi:putative ABC transport system permease protein
MRRVALKGLWLRRGRALLTTLAVVLGVAMVCGTYILTDTIDKAFNSIFSAANAGTNAVVTAKSKVEDSMSGNATIPASLLDQVRKLDTVDEAAGTVEATGFGTDSVRLVGADGKTIGNANAPKLGVGADFSVERFNPFTVAAGRFPHGDHELAIDKGTAEKEHLKPGDTLGVAAQGAEQQFTIAGVVRYGKVDSLGGATIGLFDIPTAQKLLAKDGRLDSIAVAAAPGISDADLKASLQDALGKQVKVQTGDESAAEDSQDIEEALSFIRYFLLAFGVIALGVGAFVIYNTLTITIAQRVRELATLRALGASGKQVRRSVMIEGLALGVLASVLGLILGYFLSKGLSAAFVALGIDLPKTGEVVKPRTIIASVAVGIVITVLASVAPARRATRISPIAAMQEGARLPPKLGARRPVVGLVILAVAAALLGVGAFAGLKVGTSLPLLGIGCLVLIVAVSMLAHRTVTPLARTLGAPARRAGGAAGHLAQENASRNPARTASTAGALMIGLALVTLVATLGQGLRVSDRKALEEQASAPIVVAAKNGFDTIPSAVSRAAAQVPNAEVYAIGSDFANAFGDDVSVNGIPAGADAVTNVSSLPGPGEAVVERSYARKHDLAVGSTLKIDSPDGQTVELKVSGYQVRTSVQKIDPIFGKVLIDRATFDRAFPRSGDQYVFIAGSADLAAVKTALKDFPDVKAQTGDAWVDDRVEGIGTLLNLLYVLLALSVVVSLFGMVNTLVLSVFERTREIGMLRAVGMSRRQVRRMVRQESIITALIGAALGLPLGLLLAGLLSAALSSEGIAFAVPITSLITFTVIAILAGVLAAIAPARRAARLDVLKALQYE